MSYLTKIRKYWNKPNHAAYLFILPALLVICVFTIVPLLASFAISCFDITTSLSNARFVGLDNYRQMLRDERFINACKTTFEFTLIDVPAQVLFALIVATMVRGKLRSHKLYRAIYFLPIICSPTALGIMWSIFLHPNAGWLPYVLTKLGLPKYGFLRDPKSALITVTAIDVWRNFGITMTIFVAAMQGVPETLFEAAEIDGANKVQQFIHVTIPGIFDTLWFIIISRVIATLQVFDIVYTTTKGGPAYATETIVTYVYTRAFERTAQLGYSTAMAEGLFFVILLITICMYSFMRKQEKERY